MDASLLPLNEMGDPSLSSRRTPARPNLSRVAPLAKLPVFWSLSGKRVVVAGGSDGAAWKAELLVACGADVHAYCREEELSEGMRGMRGGDTMIGRITHHPHPWHPGIFHGATLALGDCETDAEAKAFYDAARSAGVPVNVIDKPEFCQFQFGSIVNRSPVIVSISTDGAAPILAQAIRRRIETLLPPALKQWAELAQSLRERINELLAPGAARRAFWERFVDRAFAGNEDPEDGTEQVLLAEATRLGGAPACGRVTLVGAGPGDAELLTLKAVRALQQADVILFDDLVSPEVLELARREAKRLLVGKRGGRESCRQQDINDMMVSLAKAGRRVVRLKSGDPMIFGRAGEEIARLEAEGIPVDVVPGITAASAMAARLGISLTHRDHAQSVRFVTGHSRHGDLPANTDWKSLADPSVTTVFYMGGRMARRIRAALLEHGMSDNTPVVVMAAVTRANEVRWRGALSGLPDAMDRIGVDEPVLIGIGDAFAARAMAATAERFVATA